MFFCQPLHAVHKNWQQIGGWRLFRRKYSFQIYHFINPCILSSNAKPINDATIINNFFKTLLLDHSEPLYAAQFRDPHTSLHALKMF